VTGLPGGDGLRAARLAAEEGVGKVRRVVRCVALPADHVDWFVTPTFLRDYALDHVVLTVCVCVHRRGSHRDRDPEARVPWMVGF